MSEETLAVIIKYIYDMHELKRTYQKKADKIFKEFMYSLALSREVDREGD